MHKIMQVFEYLDHILLPLSPLLMAPQQDNFFLAFHLCMEPHQNILKLAVLFHQHLYLQQQQKLHY